MRAVAGWFGRLIFDWPYLAACVVVLLVLNQGPDWLLFVGLVLLIAGGYVTRRWQWHHVRVRKMNRAVQAQGILVGLANRDGESPKVVALADEDWGHLLTLRLRAGHSVEQIEKAVPNLLPVLRCDLVRVERVDPRTVNLRCVTSTQLNSEQAGWQDNALAISDPSTAQPTMAENDGWLSSETWGDES